MIQRCIIILLATTVWLASCSDGSSAARETTATTAAAAAAALGTTAQRQALAAPLASTQAGTVDPLDAANQLMDFAETYYPDFFPGHPATASALGYTYRHYEATGIYLGVRDGEVYVLGGSFGSDVIGVGPLTRYISPRPRVLSTLCAAAGLAHDTFATPGAAVGKNAGVTLAGCGGPIDSPRWQQTAGPAVVLAADRTQTLSFDPPEPGDYAFQVSFTDALGVPRTEQVTLAVAPAAGAAAAITVRASQSARMGGKVSVRAWPTVPEGDSVKAVTWTQIEGPAVALDLKTSRLALFTAPEVPRDTVIRLRATLHTANGLSDSDEVMVLVERHLQPPATDEDAMWAGAHVPRIYPYQATGPYAAVLRRCTYDSAQYYAGPKFNLCTLGTLPFLAQDSGDAGPTVEQVMGRVLVSHDWLGRNFEAFLRTHDTQGDFRRMLRSVTAIVLSTHVRPSFYYAGTGAIYLDAESFWMTPEERDTVNEAPDYRSDFGNGLQYATLWRYVQNNKSIFAWWDPRARITRTLDDVRNEAAWLLYHELGHALDYTPPSAYAGLQRNRTAWENIVPRYVNYQLTSDTVPATYPLTSTIMAGLGGVMFQGDTATAVQKAYTAAQVAGFFSADLATDDYSYSTSFEDVAMTLEEVLMQRRLGIRRDFAITDAFDSETTSSSTVSVGWGQRGRVGEAAIRPRARAIAQALTPWLDPAELDLLPAPTALRAGESWAANLAQPAIPRRARAQGAAPTLTEMWQFQRELQRMRHHRDGGGKRLPPTAAP